MAEYKKEIGVAVTVAILLALVTGVLAITVFPGPQQMATATEQTTTSQRIMAVTVNQQAALVLGTSYLTSPGGGLAFDQAGNLWVADLQNSRVLGFMSPLSSNMTASIALGQPDFQHAYGSGWYANEMTYPSAVAFDRAGNLWVADSDNNRVTEFIPPFRNGMNASLVIGQKAKPIPAPLPDWSSTIPATTRNGLTAPEGVTFDTNGDLWVTDSWNGRVLEFKPPFSNNMNASLVIGEPDFTTSCNQQTRPLCGDPRTLNDPRAIAFDPTGNLWVTDTINLGTYATPRYQGRLLEFTSPFNNGMAATFVTNVPAGSSSIAVDSNGNLWLGCARCTSKAGGYVYEFTSPLSKSMLPSLIIGGNSTSTTSQTVTNPTGLTFDSAGNLWVVDSNGVLGFNADPHSVLGSKGRVYFQSDNGMLASLSAFTVPMNASSYPQGLFNFTILGLPAGGSVKLTVTFPETLPSGVGWVNVVSGSPLESGTVEWSQLPASMVQVNGNNMTLTLTNASQEGVISVVGGPAVSSTAASSVTSYCCTTNSSPPPLGASLIGLIPFSVAILIIIAIGFALYRKRAQERLKRNVAFSTVHVFLAPIFSVNVWVTNLV